MALNDVTQTFEFTKYISPDDTVEGRKPYQSANELLRTETSDVFAMSRIIGRVQILTFKEYMTS